MTFGRDSPFLDAEALAERRAADIAYREKVGADTPA